MKNLLRCKIGPKTHPLFLGPYLENLGFDQGWSSVVRFSLGHVNWDACFDRDRDTNIAETRTADRNSNSVQMKSYFNVLNIQFLTICSFNRYRRGLETCTQAKTFKSGHAIFFLFFRRVRATSMTQKYSRPLLEVFACIG